MSVFSLEGKLEDFAGHFESIFKDEEIFKNFVEAAKSSDEAKYNFEVSRNFSNHVQSSAFLKIASLSEYSLYRILYFEVLNRYGFDSAQNIQYLPEFKGEQGFEGQSLREESILKVSTISQVRFLFDEYEEVVEASKGETKGASRDKLEAKDLTSEGLTQAAERVIRASNRKEFKVKSFKILLSHALNHNSLEDAIKIIHTLYYRTWSLDSFSVRLSQLSVPYQDIDESDYSNLPFTFENLLKFVEDFQENKEKAPIDWLIETYL